MGPRALVAALLCSLGCAHAAPTAPPLVCPIREPVLASAPAATVVTRAPSWRLRLQEDASWTPLAEALHPFTVGRWECALGAVQAGARKLACTHASGTTVQTRVLCPQSELTLDREPTFLIGCEPG